MHSTSVEMAAKDGASNAVAASLAALLSANSAADLVGEK